MVVQAAPVTPSTVVVAVDVGKTEFAFSVVDAARASLFKARTGCPMTGPSLAQVVADITHVLPVDAVVKVGIEAAGQYHRPLLNAGWPVG
jgi:transposase